MFQNGLIYGRGCFFKFHFRTLEDQLYLGMHRLFLGNERICE